MKFGKVLCMLLILPALLAGCASTGRAPVFEMHDEVQAPGLDRESVFDLVAIWMADSYHSHKAVVESADRKRGRIVATGVAPFSYMGTEQSCRYRMIVETGDAVVRITYRDLDAFTMQGRTVMTDDVRARVTPNLKRTTYSLYRFLATRGAAMR
jgi:hypothetical protein